MEFSLFQTILLATAFLFVGFSVHLITLNKGNFLLNRLFAFILTSRSIQLISLVFISTNELRAYSLTIRIIGIITYITPATIYLYVRAFINDETKLKRKDWLHLIPAILIAINHLQLYLVSADDFGKHIVNLYFNEQQANITNSPIIPFRIEYFIRSVIFLVYIGFAWKILSQALKNKIKPLHKSLKNWLVVLLATLSIFHLISFAETIFFIQNSFPVNAVLNYSRVVLFNIILFFIFISYIIRNPIVLYGHLILPQKPLSDNIDNAFVAEIETITLPQPEPTELLLSAKQIAHYSTQIQNYISTEKPFLDTALTIGLLSNRLNIPLHHCSYLLNQVFHQSFRDFINHYRVHYFIAEYPQQANLITIETMAENAGFQNRSTFNRAFKKETGQTPSAYFAKMPQILFNKITLN